MSTYRLAKFFGQDRLGRKVTVVIHRWPLHPGNRHPLRFYGGGCWLCNVMVSEMVRHLPKVPDLSSIAVSEPVYDADGNLLRRGVSMSATAKRQLDAIMADPEKAASVQQAIDRIASEDLDREQGEVVP